MLTVSPVIVCAWVDSHQRRYSMENLTFLCIEIVYVFICILSGKVKSDHKWSLETNVTHSNVRRKPETVDKTTRLHLLPPYKHEAKISKICLMLSYIGDIIWSQSAHKCSLRYQIPSHTHLSDQSRAAPLFAAHQLVRTTVNHDIKPPSFIASNN